MRGLGAGIVSVVLLAGCGGGRFLETEPRNAGFPLYMTLPGAAPGQGSIIKVERDQALRVSSTTVATALNFPTGVAVSATGEVFFTENLPDGAGRICRLKAAGCAVVASGLHRPTTLRYDGAGYLWAGGGDGVVKYDSLGEATVISPTLTDATAFTFDDAGYVIGLASDGRLFTFSEGDPDPTDLPLETNAAVDVGVASADRLLVLDRVTGQTDGMVLARLADGSTSTIVKMLVNPTALLVEHQDVLYVAEGTPAFRLVRYDENLDTLVKVMDLEGSPGQMAFTPINGHNP